VGSTTTDPATSMTLTGTQQLELFGPSSANVTFASGATGNLILDASSQFTGTIAGLNSAAPFDTIDLADIAFGSNTTVVYLASSADTGTLTVSDGTHTANIALLGKYSPTSFKIASDGHGGTAVVDPLLSTSGSWSGVFSWPLIGIQSLVTPDGKILSYGTDQAGLQGAYKIYDVWDPITNTHNTLPNQTFTDEFCAAAQIIPQTGDVILTGGDARPLGSVNTGIADTNIFDYRTDSLTPIPSGPMAFARWYPTLITLGTGQLLILGGADLSGTGVGYPEIFTPGAGWRTLTGAYIAEIANGSGWYYPRAWQASDGKVIAVAAGGSAVYAIDPSGNGQVSVVAQAPVSLNFGEPAIMFAPDRCLILGSDGSVWVMDISGPTPVFTRTGGLAPDRIWSNLTVLPDGRVMVSGGSAVDSNNNPSLSVADADNTVAIWDPSTGLWTSTGANAAVPRLYHSTAILLPDATILSLGGGGLDPNDPSMNHLNGEIYTPGYLFDTNGAAAVRPVIQQAPLDLSPGQTFTVRVDNPANVRTLALMPFGSTTHAFNTTARRIELPFSVQADGSLSVMLPVNSNVVPPGDWMLFAIGNNGAPSLASTVQVNPYLSLSNTLGTDTGSTATITSGGTSKDNTLALSGTLSVAKGFSSVQVYDGATLLGPATVSSGNWSYTTPALLDGSHSFTAKATDNAGNTTTTSAVTAMVDTKPPTLSGIVASPATANLNAGKTVTLTANFSEAVSVGSGMPTLNLNDGGTATYVSGSGSSALTFTYTIAAGQNTSDLQVNGFNGATIQDGAGNSANLSGITAANPVNPTGTLKIDTTAPTVISVVASPSKGTIATGKTVKITLNMSENVTVATGAGSPTLLLNDGGAATYTSGSGTKALTFTYTVPANQGTADLQVVGIILPSANSIQDLAGNVANLSGAAADLKLKIDTVTTTASGATISGAQTLELFGASAENITFSAGSTGTLRLDAATSFNGTVSGLALGNALDLANVAYTAGMTVGYQPNTSGPAGGLLTVGSANIALLGNYMASMFVASSDGQGGTIVVDPPPTSTTQSPILTQHVA
jgi:Galactose oxidase-like, Early set domain/Bacterial Ig-like domain